MTKRKHLKNRDSSGKNVPAPLSLLIDYEETKPLFSLEYTTCRGYAVRSCGIQDKAIFLDAIHKRSGLTWKQLRNERYENGLGWEILQNERTNMRLRKMAKKKLTDDVKMWIFRAKPKTIKRIVGHRENQVFYILFLDPNGSLYEH